jgi:hypothetical protein
MPGNARAGQFRHDGEPGTSDESPYDRRQGQPRRPPEAEGTPGHEKLMSLMREIAAYRPAVLVEAPKAVPETERLARRLDAFEASLAPHYAPHWHAMIGGDLRLTPTPSE